MERPAILSRSGIPLTGKSLQIAELPRDRQPSLYVPMRVANNKEFTKSFVQRPARAEPIVPRGMFF